MTDSIIDVQHLTHRYGNRTALEDFSIYVRAGQACALLGPNGSGKSTLFRVLSTLVPPQEGRVVILGHDAATEASEIRRHLGVIFQSPGLDKQLTAEENLRHHGHLHGLRGAELRDRIDEMLGEVNLRDRARERIGTFSGGMRRRVEIAKALLTRPRILLMDEPSTGLDPVARQDLWRYVHDVRRRTGLTVLLTTHLMDEADACDQVAILDRGRLVAEGTPAALKERVGGDVITLTGEDPQRLREALRSQLRVEADHVSGAVRFERPRGHEFVPVLIESLPGMINSVSVGKPTLDDVFVQLTGHALSEE